MTSTLASIDRALLHGVSGGFPNGLPNQGQPQPEPKTWIDGLNKSLRDRGYDPNIDPGGERKPPNGDMDSGIVKQFDPFSTSTPSADI